MTKKIFLFLVLSSCLELATAQQADSISFIKAKWEKTRINKKTKLITYHFNHKKLFGANQNISYLEVKNKGRKPQLAIAAEEKVLQTTSKFGAEHQAIAALNGTFFYIKNVGSVDFVKVDQKIINPNSLEKDNSISSHQQAAILIENGKLSLQKWDGTDDWEQRLPAANVMLSGPLLNLNKVEERIDSNAFNTNRHPRTAIGTKPDGKVILLTVDGRNPNSAGVSLPELLKIMKWLGCTSSINLDGGGSTTLWIDGFPENGVINYPSDNQRWDHGAERKVANTILLKN